MVYLATWTSKQDVWAGWVACATRTEAQRQIEGLTMLGDKNLAILEVENLTGSFNPGTRMIYPLTAQR
jgi:hypothetical protein